jgi:hypothetical protein
MFHAGSSPYLRATFARPAIPGSSLADAPDPKTWPVALHESSQGGERVSGDEDALALALAKENFVLLIIDPRRVEMLDLRASPHERTEWVRRDGEWIETALVP